MSEKLTRPLLLIGCGKMGGAMLDGWLKSGVAAAGVHIVDPTGAAPFQGRDRVTIHAGADDLPDDLDPEVVVLAVKPQQMDDVLAPLARFAGPETLFVSVAAGKTIGYFERMLGAEAAIVRAMPNTPAAIGRGITVCCPNEVCSAGQKALAERLLKAVGEAETVEDEALIDAVTGLSGGGPAYTFLLIECMAKAGVEAGLPDALAAKLALHTVAGAGELAIQSDEEPAELRRNVTSPKGTTEQALNVLMREQDGLGPLMTEAIAAATRRSKELAG
ncbi:MAG: pyrroline-5-carboxylate reductase [Marivibrio sp.]|uniref:pyrroline-5-carboxylate reductase n=1 Tax=Marivibrio sp. TaxID=2039719 RepID=UPI0032EB98D1